MKIDEFDYFLPPELIAQTPAEKRGGDRMLVVGCGAAGLADRSFSQFADYCRSGDLLVVNDTRVVPARLMCRKISGGQVEVMLERMLAGGEFLALARTSKGLKKGQQLYIGSDPEIEYVGREGAFFRFRILTGNSADPFELFHRHGQVPLPPYIRRAPGQQDEERYQTVYAQSEGAVAAPTAGLHFYPAMFEDLARKGVATAQITLHVGAGTFQPVKVDDITQHKMHREWAQVSEGVVDAIKRCKASGGRVIAVGTTTVRALESAALQSGLSPLSGPTDVFIYPGFDFKVVDCLLTNFHLPRSTLLMMISAFAGHERIRAAYVHAVAEKYRFFSYGDAMLVDRHPRDQVQV